MPLSLAFGKGGSEPPEALMGPVSRWVRWFDGDDLAGEAELRGFDLPLLRRLVGAPPADPLYDCWPVPPGRLPELAAFGPVPAPVEGLAYFLESDAEPGAGADGRSLTGFL